MLKQLRDAGIDVPFVGGDGLYGADFGKAAGAAGEGAIITCPCVPIEDGHVRGGLRGRERRRARRLRRRGLRRHERSSWTRFEDGARTREEIEEFVDDYDEQGLTKQIKFDDNGDVAVENVVIWAYKVEDGKLVPDQEISLS